MTQTPVPPPGGAGDGAGRDGLGDGEAGGAGDGEVPGAGEPGAGDTRPGPGCPARCARPVPGEMPATGTGCRRA